MSQRSDVIRFRFAIECIEFLEALDGKHRVKLESFLAHARYRCDRLRKAFIAARTSHFNTLFRAGVTGVYVSVKHRHVRLSIEWLYYLFGLELCEREIVEDKSIPETLNQ